MTTLELLTKEEIEKIYKEHMVIDFPADELKPLPMIYKAMDAGKYECYGLKDDGEICGYCFLVKLGKDYLGDYIATYPEIRNKGLGAELVHHMAEMLKDAHSLIMEVEDPEFAETEEDRILQTRRLNFYLRNGVIDTGVKARCFGVPFKILEIVTSHPHSKEELQDLYRRHYAAVLPKEMFEKNVEI